MKLSRKHSPVILTSLLAGILLFFPFLTFAQETPEASWLQQTVWFILIAITGAILKVAAILFDNSVNWFVIGFGNLYLGSGLGVAIDRIWFILRDFVNMLFIFGLVYIGFKMILDADNSNTRRWLVNLLIAAILINFSLFITKAVVDFSNQLATQIAISGLGATETTDDYGQADKEKTYKVELSIHIFQVMGVANLLNLTVTDPGAGGWGYIFGTAIFFLITAFVMAAGAFILMARFIALNFFLLVSPFMFISWILPPVSDTMNKYWEKFIGKAFFAPIYFLFLYFSLEVLAGLQTTLGLATKGAAWADTFAAKDGQVAMEAGQSTLPFFFVICGFMIGSLIISKKLGADGASKAMSIGNSIKNKAIGYSKKGAGRLAGAPLGLAARGAQGTVGLAADRLSKSRRFQGLAANSKLARAALRGTRKVADSSFDVRNVGGLGKAAGLGAGMKGGYQTRVKNKIKRDEEFFKSLDDADMKDPANKARAAALADEKAAPANKEIDDANDNIQHAENEAETVAARQANEGKSETELAGEMDALAEQIVALNVSMKERTEAGTITTQEKAYVEKKLEETRAALKSKTLAKEDMARQRTLTDDINQARNAENATGDPAEKAIHRERRQQLQNELAAHKDLEQREAKSQEAIIQANKEIAKAKEAVAKASVDAENEIKYENKIKYLKAKEKKFKPTTFNVNGQEVQGGFKFNPMEEASHESLAKKFGLTAADMAKKSKDKTEAEKLAKDLAEFQKKNGGGDDKKEGDGDKKEE